ncbi:MAG: hypothetical protein SVG88_13195 [Halobacteriales archaeon]|nr:hypothetical protein [Halobacteriales archaeon]
MDETVRDRLWVGALALARRRQSFTVDEVLDVADVDQDQQDTAIAVLTTMAEYGFLTAEADGGPWRTGSSTPLTDPDPSGFDGTFTYLTAPQTRWTFEPPAVRKWVERHLTGRVLNLFAGATELAHDGTVVRNDIDESISATYHVDAVDIGAHVAPESFETVVLDPPLSDRSNRSASSTPRSITPGKLTRIKNQVVELVGMGGTVLTFSRSSSGLGSTRGFEKRELCLINHPGSFDDTIAVVEQRVE